MSVVHTKYPFFNLIMNEEQAELALSVLLEYGSERERRLLRPEAERLQQDFMRCEGANTIVEAVNNLLAAYLEMNGEFSDELTIFLSKSLIEQKLAKAA